MLTQHLRPSHHVMFGLAPVTSLGLSPVIRPPLRPFGLLSGNKFLKHTSTTITILDKPEHDLVTGRGLNC